MFKKIALRANLLETEIGSEIVLFDPDFNQAHSLGPSASRVFRHLQSGRAVDVDDPEIVSILAEFQTKGLLEEDQSFTRREALCILTKVAVVTSVLLPTPAAAQSGIVISEAACDSDPSNCGAPCPPDALDNARVCSTTGIPNVCGCVVTATATCPC